MRDTSLGIIAVSPCRRARPPVTSLGRGVTLHALAALVLLAAAATTVRAQAVSTTARATVTRIDLGTLGGSQSIAEAVNANGQVVGSSDLAGDNESHAFSWTAIGGMVDLGTLGGRYSRAWAVNASGQVVGESNTGRGELETHAFSWTATGGMIDLGTLGGIYSTATAVNASGQVVGYSRTGRGCLPGDPQSCEAHAFVWTLADGMTDLGTLGGLESAATAVNDSGQVVGLVVGLSLTGFRASRPFSWTAAGGMVDLHSLSGNLGGGYVGSALAVNAGGQVVGEDDSSGERHSFSWTATGGMIDLGTFGGTFSSALAVNNSGQVVGESQTTGDATNHAFSWTATGGMIDLGTLGGENSWALAVNASGWVVGRSQIPCSPSQRPAAMHAFWWTVTGGMVDLGHGTAVAVNDSGQIVGGTAGVDFVQHAVLWQVALDSPPERLVVHDVQASSELTFSLEASHAADGDPLTRWSSEFSDSQFIQVDLGQDTAFDRIVLRWELARAAEYEIQVSRDREAWSTLRRVVASGEVDDLSDLVGSARYVRMQGLKRATHWGYSLFEFEVYRDGINIAAGRPMTASSTERMVFPARFAVDGDPRTRWISDFADEQWLAVDLGINVSLDRVVLKWDAAYAADYDLVVSNDGSSWTTVRTVTDGDGGVDELTDLTAESRYVGLFLHRRGTPWGFSLWEFEAYGSPTGIAP